MNQRIVWTALALIVPTAARAEDVWCEQSQMAVDRAGVSAVEVFNARGEILARPSADGRIHVQALKVVRATGPARRRELSRETVVETSRQDGRFVVQVRYPQRHTVRVSLWKTFGDFTLPRVDVRIVLEVPAGLPVVLNSTSGDLRSEDLAGVQTLRTTSGDVNVQGARAPVQVSTTSGDISGSDIGNARVVTVSGDLDFSDSRGVIIATSTSGDVVVRGSSDSLGVRTVSGNVEAEGARRGVSVSTTSGDIRIRRASGNVQIASQSGEVAAGLAPPLHSANIEASSGDIHAKLARTLGCRLDVRTSNGTIGIELPVQAKTVTRRMITAVVREGTTPVQLRTSSGSITVTEGEGRP